MAWGGVPGPGGPVPGLWLTVPLFGRGQGGGAGWGGTQGSALGLGRWQAGQAEARAGHRAAQHTKGKASTPSPHLSYLPIHIGHGNDNGMAAWQGGQRLPGSASAGAEPGGAAATGRPRFEGNCGRRP